MIEEQTTLPTGWNWSTLGEVAKYINGRAFKPSEWEDNGRPIIRIQNLTGSTKTINRYSGNVEEKFIVRDGDLLISWSATLGAYIYRGEEAVLNQHIFKVVPRIEKKFLYYLVQAYLSDLQKKVHGSGMQHITKDKFEDSIIPLPPLDEQQRIVSRIEELFTQLDAGIAALEAVHGQVKRYRQAVLHAAVSGKLFIRSEISDGQLPKGWKKVKVSEVSEVRLGRQRSPSRATGPNMTQYLRAANVTWRGLDLSDVKQMDFSPKEQETYRLQPGDVILNEASGSIGEVGKPAIWKGQIESCCFQNTLLRVRTKGPLPEYLYYHFLNDASNEKFRYAARGVGIHHLGSEGLSNWCIAIPPVSEQKEIVLEIDRRLTTAEQINISIDKSLRQAARLRQSILQRAFNGKL